jgi:hypothetical protein
MSACLHNATVGDNDNPIHSSNSAKLLRDNEIGVKHSFRNDP